MKNIARVTLYILAVLLVSVSAEPPAPKNLSVEVQGEVKHPGTYSLEARASAKDAITAAGGFTPLGSVRYTSVARALDGKKVVFNLHPESSPQNRGLDFPLMSGDLIYVFHEVY
jgi:protein involved in polysaccharide export with SLBB domain